ncbi:unnamed protein product [Amoebophrya sp. A25]|nr:unnamed protein product [Amoebophrya sp. A25]|eukprot:GSA25T00010175001.1
MVFEEQSRHQRWSEIRKRLTSFFSRSTDGLSAAVTADRLLNGLASSSGEGDVSRLSSSSAVVGESDVSTASQTLQQYSSGAEDVHVATSKTNQELASSSTPSSSGLQQQIQHRISEPPLTDPRLTDPRLADPQPEASPLGPPTPLPDDNPYLFRRDQLPLSTRGRDIIDAAGKRVKLRCVNWSGGQLETFVVGGLQVQTLEHVALAIRKLHFNCVRLVYSLDLVFEKQTTPVAAIAANQPLLDANADQQPYQILFKKTVEALTNLKIAVILNNHNSDAGWCCSALDGNGLWYSSSYPEKNWLDHLSQVARDFRDNPYVVGIDLRNEVRAANGVLPKWYTGDKATDWGSAALRGGIGVNLENPDMLVVVGGVWYNMFLCDVPKLPIHEFLPGKVVYTSHAYSWFSNRLQVANVLRYYSASLGGVVLLLWTLVVIFSFIQRWHPRMASITRGFVRLQKWFRMENTYCSIADPVYLGAILSAISVPIFGFIGARESGCDLTEQVVGIACVTLATIGGVLSVLLWTIVLMRYLFTDPQFKRRILTLCAGNLPEDDRTETGDYSHTGGEARAASTLMELDTVTDTSVLATSSSLTEVQDNLARSGLTASPSGTSSTLSLLERPLSVQGTRSHSQEPTDHLPDEVPVQEALRLMAPPVSIRSRMSLLVALAVTCTMIVFSVFEQELRSYDRLREEYDTNWGFLVRKNIAPVWLGEFGIGRGSSDSAWFVDAFHYVDQELDIGWSYWPIDGRVGLGSGESFGILTPDYTHIRDVEKVRKLTHNKLNMTTNATTGETFVPGFGGNGTYPPGFDPDDDGR